MSSSILSLVKSRPVLTSLNLTTSHAPVFSQDNVAVPSTEPKLKQSLLHINHFYISNIDLSPATKDLTTMNSMFRAKRLLPISLNLLAIGGSTYYLQSKIAYNLEEQEARLDEIEGTLRGHIGLIEDALDRIEGKKDGKKMEELYEKRGRDEKTKK
jgi:hypothetical protein